jgi:hypothetical protein
VLDIELDIPSRSLADSQMGRGDDVWAKWDYIVVGEAASVPLFSFHDS